MTKIAVRSDINKLVQYMFMMVVIIYGQTVWIRLNYNASIYTYLYIALCVIAFFLICLHGTVKLNSVIMSIILVGILFFYYMLSNYGQNMIIRISALLGLLVIYLWSLFDSGQILDFIKKYSDIIFIIAFVSIILYILGPTLNIIQGQTVNYFWAGRDRICTTYFHLLYVTQTEEFFGFTFVRNSAIFCEAPSYAVPLLISLFIELFAMEKINKTRIVVFSIAIITSFSTKAFLVVGVMVALKLFHLSAFDRRNSGNTRILRMLVPIAIIIVCFVMLALVNQKSDSNSYISRMDNLSSTMTAFRKHWFIGVGLENEEAIAQYSGRALDRYGFSIGVTLLLAEGGIYMALFYLSSFIKGFISSHDKWLVFCTFVVYFAILFTSNIPYFPSTIFILALGFAAHKKRNRQYIT